MTVVPATNQDQIRASIIRARKNHITNLELKRDNIIEEIRIQKDNLWAFQKTMVPVISKQSGGLTQ